MEQGVQTGELSKVAQDVRCWLEKVALPLWARAGVNPEHGGFREYLTREGDVEDGGITRLRVQARQIYVFSHGAMLGWSEGLEGARRGFEFLISYGWREDSGGWCHRLTAEGTVYDGLRDTYDHAFVLLALAWYYRASRDDRALALIRRTLLFLDTHLLDTTHGGYREGLPDEGHRRQNPHMHLLESMGALYEATGEIDYIVRSAELVTLLERHFLDADKGVLREFFAEDWQPIQTGKGEIWEPGHHYEWVWLLWCCKRWSVPFSSALPDRLFQFAEEQGINSTTGLVWDGVGLDGTIRGPTHRLWPQTERLRALIVRYKAGQTEASAITDFVEALFRYYLNDPLVTPGLWVDCVDAEGMPMGHVVPASTFYHLFGAFAALMSVA
ncbi:MAG: AGE family epimerase/isomerase [Parvularculales bacterium]